MTIMTIKLLDGPMRRAFFAIVNDSKCCDFGHMFPGQAADCAGLFDKLRKMSEHIQSQI